MNINVQEKLGLEMSFMMRGRASRGCRDKNCLIYCNLDFQLCIYVPDQFYNRFYNFLFLYQGCIYRIGRIVTPVAAKG
jgi:hypothetical protein